MIGYTKSALDAGTVIPVDTNVFTANCGKINVNDVEGYVARDVKQHQATDPRMLNKWCNGALDYLNTSTNFISISDAGINGADSQPRFSKVTDPQDPTKVAYKFELKQGDPPAGAPRIEISQSGAGAYIPRGVDHWICFAFIPPSSWKNANSTPPQNGNGLHDETCLWQMHDVGDSPGTIDSATQNPNIALMVHGGGSGTPELSKQYITIRDSQTFATIANQAHVRTAYTENNYPADVWQYWIINIRLHWDATYSPFMKAWRRLGYTGDWTQLVDDTGPNQYNNTNDDYHKAGIYYYADEWSGGVTSRVLYNKGLYCFRDDGTITRDAIAEFMDKI